MENSQEELVQKVMLLMRANLSEPLSVPDLAKKVRHSHSYLRHIFRKATGKGILSLFVELRMDKAKKLLCDTRMNISEISLECGYGTYKRFRAAFKEKMGCSPKEYRKYQANAQQSAIQIPEDGKQIPDLHYYDSLKGPDTSSTLKPINGTWIQQSGYYSGNSPDEAALLVNEIMPKNFILRFEARLFRRPEVSSSEISLSLNDATKFHEYYGITLGKMGGTYNEFRTWGAEQLVNSTVVIQQEMWHKMQLELEDDTVTFTLDGEELFKFRQPFPPPLSRNTNLTLSTFNGEMGLRELELIDRGFLPLVKSIRQGDALYNARFFSSARAFYLRLLSSKISALDTVELQYKIGQCFFKEAEYDSARTWMEKVTKTPLEGFWIDHARWSELELNILEGHFEETEQRVRTMFEEAAHRQQMRLILNHASDIFENHGFFEKSLALRSLHFQLEKGQNCLRLETEFLLAETLVMVCRYKEAMSHYLSIIRNPLVLAPIKKYTLFTFCTTSGMQGNQNQHQDALKELAVLSAHSPVDEARTAVYGAIYQRAAGNNAAAIAEIQSIQKMHSAVKNWTAFASILGAHMYCCQGEIEKAKAWLKEAASMDPKHPRLTKGLRSISFYPVELALSNFEEAARYLLEDSEVNLESWMGAEQMVKAGILISLAGKASKAKAVWEKAGNLFPQNKFNFFGSLFEDLIKEKLETSLQIPYPGEKRSELFYLLGRLCEYRGEKATAKIYFKMSMETDLLNNWPACMAKKRLQDL